MEESTLKVDCNGAKVPAWIMSRGKKLNYDRPAFIDDEGRSPMSQMRADECLIAPGAIYREEGEPLIKLGEVNLSFSRNHDGDMLVLVDNNVIKLAKDCPGFDL